MATDTGRSPSGRAASLRPQPASQSSQSGIPNAAWPDVLTDELANLLGRPCFMFIKHAQAFRAAGFDIHTSAEAEQAFFLHRFLGHWFRHGDNWREHANEDLRAVYAQAIEARRAETGTGSVEDESAVPQGCAQGHSDDH